MMVCKIAKKTYWYTFSFLFIVKVICGWTFFISSYHIQSKNSGNSFTNKQTVKSNESEADVI